MEILEKTYEYRDGDVVDLMQGEFNVSSVSSYDYNEVVLNNKEYGIIYENFNSRERIDNSRINSPDYYETISKLKIEDVILINIDFSNRDFIDGKFDITCKKENFDLLMDYFRASGWHVSDLYYLPNVRFHYAKNARKIKMYDDSLDNVVHFENMFNIVNNFNEEIINYLDELNFLYFIDNQKTLKVEKENLNVLFNYLNFNRITDNNGNSLNKEEYSNETYYFNIKYDKLIEKNSPCFKKDIVYFKDIIGTYEDFIEGKISITLNTDDLKYNNDETVLNTFPNRDIVKQNKIFFIKLYINNPNVKIEHDINFKDFFNIPVSNGYYSKYVNSIFGVGEYNNPLIYYKDSYYTSIEKVEDLLEKGIDDGEYNINNTDYRRLLIECEKLRLELDLPKAHKKDMVWIVKTLKDVLLQRKETIFNSINDLCLTDNIKIWFLLAIQKNSKIYKENEVLIVEGEVFQEPVKLILEIDLFTKITSLNYNTIELLVDNIKLNNE